MSTTTPSAPEPHKDLLHNLTVWTPEIDRLAERAAKWIRMDLPGATVYGHQRTGKSRACRYLKSGLSDVLGYAVATVVWSILPKDDSKKTEREFVQEMMTQSGCTRLGGRDLAILRKRFISHLLELAMLEGSKRIVIIVDEAQNLTHSQYGYLIHLYNSLEQRDIQPFFLLVGQNELRNQPSTWAESGAMQVLGRFFSREYTYRGISIEELGMVLQAFDTPLQDDNLSPLAFHFPADYAVGWSLEKLTPVFSETFQMVISQHNIQGTLYMPMQYLRSALLTILYLAAEENIPLHRVNSELVYKAIQETNFFKVMAHYIENRPSP